jgi:hypothetical protein
VLYRETHVLLYDLADAGARLYRVPDIRLKWGLPQVLDRFNACGAAALRLRPEAVQESSRRPHILKAHYTAVRIAKHDNLSW